jgi:hypothetical protein
MYLFITVPVCDVATFVAVSDISASYVVAAADTGDVIFEESPFSVVLEAATFAATVVFIDALWLGVLSFSSLCITVV